MKCPFCRRTNTEIYNSRTTRFGSQTWRRRRCTDCGQTFTTYEAVDLSGLLRVDGPAGQRRYSRARLYASLLAVLGPRANDPATAEAIADTVEAKLLDLQHRTVSRQQIVDNVLSTLKHLDSSAFLRYLAAHSDFPTTAKLSRELKKY